MIHRCILHFFLLKLLSDVKGSKSSVRNCERSCQTMVCTAVAITHTQTAKIPYFIAFTERDASPHVGTQSLRYVDRCRYANSHGDAVGSRCYERPPFKHRKRRAGALEWPDTPTAECRPLWRPCNKTRRSELACKVVAARSPGRGPREQGPSKTRQGPGKNNCTDRVPSIWVSR